MLAMYVVVDVSCCGTRHGAATSTRSATIARRPDWPASPSTGSSCRRYLVAGFIFAITAWILIGRVGAASPNVASDANLDSITAVVIGGTSLFGGRGIIVGSLLGALIVGVFRNGLALAGVDVLYQTLAIGVLVIVAVATDQWIRRVRA